MCVGTQAGCAGTRQGPNMHHVPWALGPIIKANAGGESGSTKAGRAYGRLGANIACGDVLHERMRGRTTCVFAPRLAMWAHGMEKNIRHVHVSCHKMAPARQNVVFGHTHGYHSVH